MLKMTNLNSGGSARHVRARLPSFAGSQEEQHDRCRRPDCAGRRCWRSAQAAGVPGVRFWLVNIGDAGLQAPRQPKDYSLQPGLKAIYKVCVHLGCVYKWVPTNDRFECPCHGSKYLKSGARIDGPDRRHLDAFFIEALGANGNVLSPSEPALGSP